LEYFNKYNKEDIYRKFWDKKKGDCQTYLPHRTY